MAGGVFAWCAEGICRMKKLARRVRAMQSAVLVVDGAERAPTAN